MKITKEMMNSAGYSFVPSVRDHNALISVETPEGDWKLLRFDDTINRGDHYLAADDFTWIPVQNMFGSQVGGHLRWFIRRTGPTLTLQKIKDAGFNVNEDPDYYNKACVFPMPSNDWTIKRVGEIIQPEDMVLDLISGWLKDRTTAGLKIIKNSVLHITHEPAQTLSVDEEKRRQLLFFFGSSWHGGLR